MKNFRRILKIILVIAIIALILPFLLNFFNRHSDNKQAEAIAKDIGEANTSETCQHYVTDDNGFDMSEYKDGEDIGYMIFPTISPQKWTIKGSTVGSYTVDEILKYSLAIDRNYESLGEAGNTVILGHNYLALKNIEKLFNNGYAVIKTKDSTYVYKVYEHKYIDATNAEYVYNTGVENLYDADGRFVAPNENDILTLYTCTQNFPGPVTGRTVVKLQLVEEYNDCDTDTTNG